MFSIIRYLHRNGRGSEVVPGALPMADGGAIYIDELDKFAKKDLAGLLEAMEEGEVTITVGRIKSKLSAKCRVIASANKTDKFSPELLDRFDIKIELRALSEEEEQDISSIIAESWRVSKPTFYGDELRAYLQYVRSFDPEITSDTHQKLRELMYHYTAIEHSIRGSARKKEAVLRVAYAIAKLNGRSLLIDDALKAIKILNETITESQLEYLRVKALSSGSIV